MAFRAPICTCDEDSMKKLPTKKISKPDIFQERVLKTWSSESDYSEQLMHAAMGLSGEAGELLDLVKKGLFKPNYSLSRDDLVDELGDCLYYLAVASSLLGISIEELSVHNRNKLSKGKHGWKDHSGEHLQAEQAQAEIDKLLASDLDNRQIISKIYGILASLGDGYDSPLIVSITSPTVFSQEWMVTIKHEDSTLLQFVLNQELSRLWRPDL